MVEHTLRTVHESLVQGYCATADCATGDCARLRDKRYYCTTGKEKNTTSYARNRYLLADKNKFNDIVERLMSVNESVLGNLIECIKKESVEPETDEEKNASVYYLT